MGYMTPLALPFFGAKLDLALGAKYNLEGAKVQGFYGIKIIYEIENSRTFSKTF